MRLFLKHLVGFIAIFIAICILVSIFDFGYDFLGPLFLFGLGIILHQHVHRWLGIISYALGCIALFMNVFQINIAGLLIALMLIYFGYTLLTKHKNRNEKHTAESEEKWNLTSPCYRSSFISNVSLVHHQFEMDGVNLSYCIGDTKIDLSKAIIPEGETAIVVSGLIGDVDIFIPYDLEVSVSAAVTVGELEILGSKESGFNRQLNLATKGYKESLRKVKISVSILIGDIDVRYL